MKCSKCGKDTFFRNGKSQPWICNSCGYTPPLASDGTKTDQGDDNNSIVGTTNNHYKPLSNHYVDCHNSAFKFKILKDEKFGKKSHGFKGKTTWLTFKGHKVMHSKKWLIIYNNRRIKTDTDNLEQANDDIREEIVKIACELSNYYNIEINPTPYRLSENRPEVKLVNIKSNVNFVESEVKAVYPLPSPIEFTGKNAVKNTLNFTGMLDILHADLDKLSKELKIHSEVEQRANEFLRQANESLKPPKPIPPPKPSKLLTGLENLLSSAVKLKEGIESI